MRKEELYYKSSDEITDIHCIYWYPDELPKGIIQICHGMSEYIDRYDDFASYLASQGFLVVGNDHLGHGKSVNEEDLHGYFAQKHGNDCVIKDIKFLHDKVASDNQGIPYILFGHSMGSFLARQYCITYKDDIDGAIIMGTGNQPPILTGFGMLFCKIISLFKGWKYRSPFVANLAMGSYNKKFGKKDGFEWLSVNKDNVIKYMADQDCGEMFTLNGYYNMFKGINFVSLEKNMLEMDMDKPILLISGEDDPVGNYGKDVISLFEKYKSLGANNVELKLYSGLRHEILNEDSKEEVYDNIIKWIENKIYNK